MARGEINSALVRFFPSVVLSFWEHDSQSETRPEHKRVLLRWVCRLYHSATQLEHYPRSVVMVLQASTDPPRASMVCILLSLGRVDESVTSGKAGGLKKVEPLKADRSGEPLKAVRL